MTANLLEAVKAQDVSSELPSAKLPSAAVIASLEAEDQVLLTKLLTEPTDFVDHPDFSKRGIEKKLFGGEAKFTGRDATRFLDAPDPVSDALRTGERMPALSHADEQHIFMRFNYARSRVREIIIAFAGKSLTRATTRRLLAWGHRVLAARAMIVRQNMPLVLAMGKRTRLAVIDFNELVSEGNMALLRSVEKFDCSRGFKFSTYSCRAILKSFSRVAMRASRYRGTFPTEFDPAMERSDFLESKRSCIIDDCVTELKQIIMENHAKLSEVENTVIRERFAMGRAENGSAASPKTLEQVGHIIGVTKERVRQIQNKALKKIKVVLEDRYLAA